MHTSQRAGKASHRTLSTSALAVPTAAAQSAPKATASRRPPPQGGRETLGAARRLFLMNGVALAPPAYGIDFVDRGTQAEPNRTGLPDRLKAGIESLSGLSLDHVKVHRNSSRPAQLDALAYAMGSEIHVAPGQQHLLAHEAWHLVQQAQGRVKPTGQKSDGLPVNDDPRLEQEADAMGALAETGPAPRLREGHWPVLSSPATPGTAPAAPVVQRVKTILRDGVETVVDDMHRLKWNERLPFSARRREQIDATLGLSRADAPKPWVGISNRPGLGYDASVFTAAPGRPVPSSLPPGFGPLPYVAKSQPGYLESVARAELEKTRVQKARDPDAVRRHLDGVSGLFVPGGQDRDEEGSPEKITRQAYERALVREARKRGMPTLAVCGGSRAFLGGFGGSEQDLNKAQIKTHNQGTGSKAHGLTFPVAHTLIGDASPTFGTLDKINSTHKKVGATGVDGRLTGVPDLPGTGRVLKHPDGDIHLPKESELVVSALDAVHGTPEGFETRYGAPQMGITSHPEAIYRGSDDRNSATPDARLWSDALFKGFDQSMGAYQGKQAVNQAIAPGWTAAVRARQANPGAYAKWRGKRNWQKLQQLGMITEREAEEIRAEVAQHRRRKADYFRGGRPGRERPDPSG